MKKKLILIGIISSMLVSAYQRDYLPVDTNPTGSTGSGAFRAKIDGVQWEALSVKTAAKQSDVIVVYGSTNNNKSILLRVADSGVHNYTFTTESLTNVAAFIDSSISPYASFTTNGWDLPGTYGNLNITSIDPVRKTMSGTFSIKVYRPLDSLRRTITEGVFTNISYSTQPPAPSGTDTFRVKVGGLAFTYNLLASISTFGKINISVAQNVAPAVGLSVPDDATPGTYDYDLITYHGQYNPSASVFLGADTGKITILEHNKVTKRIRGNFHFLANTAFTHAPPNVLLTEGYFSVKYQ